ncbi:MAG: PAS domain-containing sensor histidine kinase, partial [Methanomicrobium sp.]|nr:PAS domain-containing sensor histidine kinase [Methanomicrobium sp.]
MINTVDEEGDHFETVHTRKDGSEIKVEISSNAAYFSGKKLILYVVRDITARKRAEDLLRSVNKKLNLLSYITCHDILNKALAINIFLSLLDENDLKPEISAYLGEANRAVKAIERQIEFAREYEMVGLKEPLWLSVKKLTEGLFDMRLEINVDSKGAFVYADAMMERVFYNLFDNTLRHAEGATTVNIICRETADSTLLITWEDNGPGIEDSLKETIFKRCYGKNRGFGLFLAREILGISNITISETGVYGKG